MNKKMLLVGLLFFAIFTAPAVAFRARAPRYTLLRDGFTLNGVEGKLVFQGGGTSVTGGRRASGWFLELESDVNDLRVYTRTGTKLELLPSSALEKMIADANGSSGASYRLWGWVTKYKDRNYIFVNLFLPLGKAAEAQPKTSQQAQPRQDMPAEEPLAKESERKPAVSEPGDLLTLPAGMAGMLEDNKETGLEEAKPEKEEQAKEPPSKEAVKKPAINEPDDLLRLPAGIVERLEAKKTEAPQKRPARRPQRPARRPQGKMVKSQPDTVLANRTAFLVEADNGGFNFVLDSLGLNVKPVSLPLLPCEVLELTELKQSSVPERLRFKISGVITNYEGEQYLLLQKATRAYNYGNFGG